MTPNPTVAHDAVATAIRTGRLVRPDECSECGDDSHRVQGHHADYTKLLDVEWLCPSCHVRRHPRKRNLPPRTVVTATVPVDLRDSFVVAIRAANPEMSVARAIRMHMRETVAEYEAQNERAAVRQRPPFRPDVVKAMLIVDSRFVGVKMHGRDADGSRVDVTGYALRLIDEDETRLGRKRARSGAERILRDAGFADPGSMYAFAMDRRSGYRHAA